MQVWKGLVIIALLMMTTNKSMAEIIFEKGDEKLQYMYNKSDYIFAEDLKVGETGFTAYLSLTVCSGKIITTASLYRDPERFIKDKSKYRSKGWWKVKRLTSETLEINYIPREFKRENLELAIRNGMDLTYWFNNFNSVVDDCAQQANKLVRKEVLTTGRRIFLNKIDNIGGKKSLREFAESMDFMIQQMEAANN